MSSDEALWDELEKAIITLLRDAFRINCYVAHNGDYVFVDQELLPHSLGHNVWNFSTTQFRACIKAATKKGMVENGV